MGFDVHADGYIDITGAADAGRAAVLVLGGPVPASAHSVIEAMIEAVIEAMIEARRRHRRANPLWADSHQTTHELNETSGVAGRLAYEVPYQRGAAWIERALANPTEGSRDG